MVATATPRASRHRVILNAATRVDRKRLRAALGPLKDLSLAAVRSGLTWGLIQAWNQKELPCRALPLTPELVAGTAGGFLVAGYPGLTAGALVSFGTLARTGGLLSLVVDDVMVDNRAGFAGMLRFRETKTGQREGSHQSVAIENAVVRGALQCLCRDLEPGKQLMQITDFKVRQVSAHVVASLQLQEFSLRPNSMRRRCNLGVAKHPLV